MNTRRLLRRLIAALLVLPVLLALASPASIAAGRQDAASPPAVDDPCAALGAATPRSTDGTGGILMGTQMPGMPMGTPGPRMTAEFDLMFIDMMIPHHEGAVLMAEVALARAERDEIRQLAAEIVRAQREEVDRLRVWREQWYPDAPAMPMDQMMSEMGQMMEGMPGMEQMPGMIGMIGMSMMDPAADARALCAAPGPFDLAFIDAMVPHHQSAIVMGQVAIETATHPALRQFAQGVIDTQQREIDQMLAWREAWTGAGTAVAAPGAVSHGGSVADRIDLIDALQAAGLTAVVVGPLQQPFLQSQSDTDIRLSGAALAGSAEVQVYEYADEAAAAAEAGLIGPDGRATGRADAAEHVEASLATKRGTVRFAPEQVSQVRIEAAKDEEGYPVAKIEA